MYKPNKIKKHITLCPTNISALLVAKLKKQAQLQTFALDYIFVYEVSMLGEVFYKFLIKMIKKIRPNIKFITSGDYSQPLL